MRFLDGFPGHQAQRPFFERVNFDPMTMTIVSAAATVAQAAGSIMSGNAARGAANFQAAQMTQQAGQEKAASQRKAIEQRRRASLANSRVQAVAAGSGAGAADPSVLKIEADNAGFGEYSAQAELYEGDEAARQLLMGAGAKRYEGAQARQASLFKAGGTLLSGGSSLMDKYNPGTLPWQEAGNVNPQGGYY